MLKKVLAVLALVAAAGAVYWSLTFKKHEPPAPPPPAVAPPPPPPPAPPPQPQIQHPLAETPTPLPSLDDSDKLMQDNLGALFGKKNLRHLVFLDRIIRRVVATVDGLGREGLAPDLSPVRPVAGEFQAEGSGDNLVIASQNAARYGAYLKIAESLDVAKVVGVYRRLYPLFQKAYRELGYPKAYFNDRLVEVIDLMLAAPEVAGPIRLTQPSARYEFADPELAKLAAGQKLMVRMGPANAARAKALLRAVRRDVAAK